MITEVDNPTSTEEILLEFLKKNPDGVSKERISASIEINDTLIVESLNWLIEQNRISIVDHNGENLFKYRSEREAAKYRDLTREEISANEIISQSGSNGISTNDIKIRTRINSTTLINKILKKLEKKLFIKSLKVLNTKNKKMWISYDIEPSQEITGGVWCNNQEFDNNLVNVFMSKCLDYIESQKQTTRKEIMLYARSTSLTKSEIKEDDIQKIINILIFDDKIDAIFPDITLGAVNKYSLLLRKNEPILNSIKYKMSREYSPKVTVFPAVPCTFCPVFRECQVDNSVQPQGCPWMKNFIQMQK